MMTKIEAQLYLAEKLPERIALGVESKTPIWIKECYPVKETEWQQIALWVEEKMTDDDFLDYSDTLTRLVNQDKSKTFTQNERDFLSANYITRATAMKESGL